MCQLEVPPIAGTSSSPDTLETARVAYRLAYELVLPYLLPLLLLAFPYVSLLLGLMRSLEATDHADKSTKMTVVVTLWVLTSYLMLQVPSVLRWVLHSSPFLATSSPSPRSAFSIFTVWHRLTTLFDAEDDPRVPAFQVQDGGDMDRIYCNAWSLAQSSQTGLSSPFPPLSTFLLIFLKYYY